MSWKPSRSSGVMFDKYTAKANENRAEAIRMIETHEYVKYANLNKFSKHIYLYWLNENKAHCSLGGKMFNKYNPWRTLLECCFFDQVFKLFKNNQEYLYKPLQDYLQQIDQNN